MIHLKALLFLLPFISPLVGGDGEEFVYRPSPQRSIQKLVDLGREFKLGSAESIAQFHLAFEEARKQGDIGGQILALNREASSCEAAWQWQHAADCYRLALPLEDTASDALAKIDTLTRLGKVLDCIGNWKSALDRFNQSYQIAHEYRYGTQEGEALTNVGTVLREIGKYDQSNTQLKISRKLFEELNDKSGLAKALTEIGCIHRDTSQNDKALQDFDQALGLARETGSRALETYVAENRAALKSMTSQKQEAIDILKDVIKARQELGNRLGELSATIDLAAVYGDLGQNATGLSLLNEVRDAEERSGDLRLQARFSNNLAKLYSHLGRKNEALDLNKKALNIRRTVGDKRGEATSLSNLGTIYRDLGDTQNAIECYEKALPLRKEIKDLNGEAYTLDNLALSYADLGLDLKAIDLYKRALAIMQKIVFRNMEAYTWSDLGLSYSHLGRYGPALEKFKKSLEIGKDAGTQASVSTTMSYSGRARNALGDFQNAVTDFTNAKLVAAKIGDRRLQALALDGLGESYLGLHNKPLALESLGQGLVFAREVQDPGIEADLLEKIARLYESAPRAALLFELLSVRKSEGMRAGVVGLSSMARRRFAETLSNRYLLLCEMLAMDNRPAEFQQVLALSKIDTARGSEQVTPFTPAEARWSEEYDRKLDAVATLGRKIAELQSVKSPAESAQREVEGLKSSKELAQLALGNFLTSIEVESSLLRSAPVDGVSTYASRLLSRQLSSLPKGTSAVYALAGRHGLHLLVVRNGAPYFLRNFPEMVLDKKVKAFLEIVKNSAYDPLPLGKDIYDSLVRPIEQKLDPRGITMWSLSGSLRGLPIAALWDGSRYMVEKFLSSMFSPDQLQTLTAPPRESGPALVFGSTKKPRVKDPVSRELVPFKALPGVATELASIGSILHLKPQVDDNFTVGRLLAGLRNKPRILHIASHFRQMPGDDRRSFLVVGDGSAWTVDHIKELPDGCLESLDLITLSACATSVGEDQVGAEAESFSAWTQRKGAKAAISTLWPIADDGAAILMPKFYKVWTSSAHKSKIAALREAQLSLIHGHSRRSPNRRLDRRRTGPDENPYIEAAKPWPSDRPAYSHPCYWAPFVLSGNWK